jgi:hypothetical protein
MGNLNSCCVYGNGSSPRQTRDAEKKSGSRSNGHFRKSGSAGLGVPGAGLDDANGVVSTHPGPGLNAPKPDESVGNLQHISEREPDDWETDPSLHPTTKTLFMEKSKQSIQSKGSC